MKNLFYFLFFALGIAIWSTPGFAVQVIGGSGTVDATGQAEGVSMTGASVDTLTVGPTFPDVFTDNRLIDGVSALNASLVAISTDTADDDTIVFNTSSTIYGTIGTTGDFFKKIDINDGFTVNFLGTVFTTSAAGSFDIGEKSIANFNSGTGTNRAAITFTGDGTANLARNTVITGAVITNTDNTGTLSLGGGSKVVGAVTGLKAINVVGGSSAAGVVGTVNGAASNIHSVSLLTNELNITGGALTFATNGVINTTIASATVYGHVLVQGGFASNLGTGLAVKVLVPESADLTPGTFFYIVRSTTGTGALARVATVDPTNPLYTFEVDKTATAGDATIKLLTVPLQTPVVNPPDDPLVPVVVPIVEPLLEAPETPDITVVRASINALSDAKDVVKAEAQLAPLAPALAAPLLTFQGSRQFQNLWQNRLDMCSEYNQFQFNEENPECLNQDPHKFLWAKGFGSYGVRKDDGAYKGFDSRILGMMIGYDMPIYSDTRAGLGFGYAQTDIDGKTFDTSTEFESYRAMAYIGHEKGPWFVNGAMSFGWHQYSGRRRILFTGMDRTANAEYDGQDYTAFASTGYRIPINRFTITPIATFQYSRVNIDGYTEKNAGDIGLNVDSQGYDFYESGLGLRVDRRFTSRGGRMIAPYMHFKWLHSFANPTLEQTAAFNVSGAKQFTTHGLQISDDTYNAGIGITLLGCECDATAWSVEAGYDYEWRNDNYAANQATIRFTKRF